MALIISPTRRIPNVLTSVTSGCGGRLRLPGRRRLDVASGRQFRTTRAASAQAAFSPLPRFPAAALPSPLTFSGFGVARRWLWGRMRVACGSQSVGYQQALGWLGGGLRWLGPPFLLSASPPGGFVRLCELPLWMLDVGCFSVSPSRSRGSGRRKFASISVIRG